MTLAWLVHEVAGGWRAWWCKWTVSPALRDKPRSGLDTGEVAEPTERGLPSLVTVPVRGFHSSFTLFHRLYSNPGYERIPRSPRGPPGPAGHLGYGTNMSRRGRSRSKRSSVGKGFLDFWWSSHTWACGS